MSLTSLRAPAAAALATALARQTPFSFSTQKRTLFFCGPKAGDHDASHPITEQYYARLKSNCSNGESLMAAASKTAARAQSPSLAKTVVAQAQEIARVIVVDKVSPTVSHLAPSKISNKILETDMCALENKKREDGL
jgi:hypothetical protein